MSEKDTKDPPKQVPPKPAQQQDAPGELWVSPATAADVPFCQWLTAVSEGKNPNEATDKFICREFARFTLLRRESEKTKAVRVRCQEDLEAAAKRREDAVAAQHVVDGRIRERIETLREIYRDLHPPAPLPGDILADAAKQQSEGGLPGLPVNHARAGESEAPN